jgi:hypothetical protein
MKNSSKTQFDFKSKTFEAIKKRESLNMKMHIAFLDEFFL